MIMFDVGDHELLEGASSAYSELTIRRAQIVWYHLGQRNKFNGVCNIYHYLEQLEETLSEEERAASRLQEFNLMFNPPPRSKFFMKYFPTLYSTLSDFDSKKPDENTDDIGFKTGGVKKEDIIDASQLIRMHCKTHFITTSVFQKDFRQFLKISSLSATIENAKMYLRNRTIADEVELHFNYANVVSDLNNMMSYKGNKNKTRKVNNSASKNNTKKALQILKSDVDTNKTSKYTNGIKV